MQNKFVCAAYDPNWDTGIVTEIDKETENGLINFMYPKRPISFFSVGFQTRLLVDSISTYYVQHRCTTFGRQQSKSVRHTIKRCYFSHSTNFSQK